MPDKRLFSDERFTLDHIKEQLQYSEDYMKPFIDAFIVARSVRAGENWITGDTPSASLNLFKCIGDRLIANYNNYTVVPALKATTPSNNEIAETITLIFVIIITGCTSLV